jgi:hypothetical protein
MKMKFTEWEFIKLAFLLRINNFVVFYYIEFIQICLMMITWLAKHFLQNVMLSLYFHINYWFAILYSYLAFDFN